MFGRFEAEARTDRWIGEGMHGPTIGRGRAILLALIDDRTRLVVGHHWGRAVDSVRLEAALRRGLAARGVPRQIYVEYVSGTDSTFCARPGYVASAASGWQERG